jgi:hypothetical protein
MSKHFLELHAPVQMQNQRMQLLQVTGQQKDELSFIQSVDMNMIPQWTCSASSIID